MANETIVRITADATGYSSALEKAQRSNQAFLSSVEAAAARTKAAQDAIAEAAANSSNASSRSINAFVQSLAKQADAAGKTRSELLQLQAAQMGVASSAQPFIDKIKAAEDAMNKGAHAADGLNFSTVGARRELLVLMHEASQGNWSKFGGSLMVLGERVDAMGLIFSAAGATAGIMAAALAAVGIAAIKGAEETKQFNAALTLTNNYAGMTSQSLQDMTQRIAGSSGESLGKASDVLMGLAQSGRYTSSEMEGLGNVIVRTSKISGAALEDIAKEYAGLAEDPAKWAYEHNQSMHFMDVSTYQHIQALQDAGDKHNAVQAIIEAVTAQVENSSTQHLSGASKAWHDLTAGVQEFWAALKKGLNDGATYQDKIDVLMTHRKSLQGDTNPMAAEEIGRTDDQIAALQELQRMQQRSADSQARIAQANQAGIEAEKNVDKMRDQLMSNAQRRQKELAQLASDRKAILAGGGTFSDADYASLEAGINDKYKDHKQAAPKAYQDDAATKFIQQIRDQDAATKAALDSSDKLTGAEKMQSEFLQKIVDLKGKDILTADQKSLLASQDKIKVALDQYVADEKTLKLKEDGIKLDERSAQINAQIANYKQSQQDQYSRQLGAIGMGADAQKNAQAVKSIYAEYERLQWQLEKETPKSQIGSDAYNAEKEKIQQGLQQSLQDYDAYYAALKTKQADWTNGATEAMANYVDASHNMMAQSEQVVNDAFKGMEDALTNFATTGKLSFSSLANSIIADLARIQAKKMVASMSEGLGNMLGLGSSSSTASTASTAAAGVGDAGAISTFMSGLGFAGGGDPPVGMASMVGEQGPELFVPKTAGTIIPNHALQGGGGQTVTYSPVINIDSRTDRAEVQVLVGKAVQKGNAQLVEQLKRARAI